MKAYEPNPWLVENLTDFNFLNCPECNYKSKNDQAFLQHAMKHHPRCKASCIFRDVKAKISKGLEKPLMSYSQLIAEALVNSEEGMLMVSDLCTAVSDKYPYFKVENENWQKGLRHQLTVNRSFTKAKKCKGAGWYWKLSEYILLLKDVKRIVDDAKMVENTAEMTEEETEGETITGDIQSVLEPDEAFVVVKEETIENVPGIMEVVREESAKDPVYDCPHCDKIFPSFGEAEGHISIEHEDLTENVIKCAECKKDLPKDPTAIKHHMITEHMVQRAPEPVLVPKKEPVQLFLRIAGGPTMSLNPDPEFEYSPLLDPAKKKYACAYCGDKFPDMATRAAHERSTHIDKEGKLFGIICDREDCQEKLPNSKEFRRHMIDKHRKNNYSLVKKESFCCDLCGKTFKAVGSLNYHKTNTHADKTVKDFKCGECDFKSYAKRYVLSHIRKVHRGLNYKHVCEHCGDKFAYPSDLKSHTCVPNRSNMRSEDLACVPCGRRFDSFKYYMTHFVRTHKTMPPGYEGRQTFKCGYANCDWQYLTQARLEKHIENCHGPNAKKKKMKNGKPKTYPIPQYKGEPGKIPCPHCNRPLADEKQLESHIKRMHDETKSLECPTCHKPFARETYLNQHLRLSISCKPDDGYHFAVVETRPNKKQKRNPAAAGGSRGQRAPAKTAWLKQETQAAVDSISTYRW